MSGIDSDKSVKGKTGRIGVDAGLSFQKEKGSPSKGGKNLWNLAQTAAKKAKQDAPGAEPHDINSLMTKNISDAFQLPINEAFSLLTKQVTKVAPNLLSKLAASSEADADGRYDRSNQSELTPFRPTYTEANIKDIIKHDFFKVIFSMFRNLANGLLANVKRSF